MLNASIMMAGAAYLSYASGLLSSILAARTLGPHDYGTYAYILWLVGVCVSIMNHGLPVGAIKFISEFMGAGQKTIAGALHGWLSRVQAWSMAFLGILIFIYLNINKPQGWGSDAVWFSVIVLIGAFSKGAYQFNTSVSKGHGLFAIEAKTVAFLSAGNVIALLGAWWIGTSLTGMLLIYAVISIGYWLCMKMLMRREAILINQEPLPTVVRERLFRHLGWTVALTAIGVFNEGSVNIYALNKFVGAADVGYYAIAAGLTKAGMDLLTAGLSSVLMSAMSHASGKNGVEGLRRVFQGAVKNFHFFGLLLAGLGLLGADWVVAILYGDRYQPAIMIMKVMFVLGGITLSEGVFASLLSVMDKQRDRVIINGLSLVLTIPVSYFLIQHHGLVGAMWAYAINRALVFLIAVISASRLAGIRAPEWALLKLTGAMILVLAPMLALLHWSPGLGVALVACTLFVIGFIAVVARLDVWQPEELSHVLKLMSRIPLLSWMKYLLPARLRKIG